MTNPRMLNLFHSLPYAARNIAASMYGLRLKQWRYSLKTEQWVQEALERESWSTERWEKWRQERLSRLLHRAATIVPYYRDLWKTRRSKGDNASVEVLENWPVLEKSAIQKNPCAFIAEDCNVRAMYREQTSGTTGTPVRLFWSRDTVQHWYSLVEARSRMWYGVSRHMRWAILGGQIVSPAKRRKPPFWIWNASLKQLYLSSYHLSPDLIPAYLEAMQGYHIRYLWGYPSALYSLAAVAIKQNTRDLQIRVVVTNAEPLYDHQREVIAAAFNCPVRETYGMAEIVAAGSECEQGRLHLWPEVGIVEDGESDVVFTGLLNLDQPLIRYRLGDVIRLAHKSDCLCGRKLPLIQSINGRSDDIVRTRDGREIGRLDPIFKGDLPLQEAQIIQESLDLLRVLYVPLRGFEAEAKVVLKRRLLERLGNIQVQLEEVQAIPRTSNGKFQAVISKLKQSSQ